MDYESIQNEFERAIFIALERLGNRSGNLSWFCKPDEPYIVDNFETHNPNLTGQT